MITNDESEKIEREAIVFLKSYSGQEGLRSTTKDTKIR
jgi:hypothetical protein